MNAQWTTDTEVNTLVSNTESGDMQAIGTSEGKTYVIFSAFPGSEICDGAAATVLTALRDLRHL